MFYKYDFFFTANPGWRSIILKMQGILGIPAPFKSLLNISFTKNPWIYETHLFMPLSLGFDKSFLKRSMFCQPQWSALDFLFLSATVQQPSLAFLGTVSDLFFHAIAMLSFLFLSRIHQQPQLLKRIQHQQFQHHRGN